MKSAQTRPQKASRTLSPAFEKIHLIHTFHEYYSLIESRQLTYRAKMQRQKAARRGREQFPAKKVQFNIDEIAGQCYDMM